MLRPINQILADIQIEQNRLNEMPLGSESTLQQSQIVDKLINEYYQVLTGER